MPNYFLLGLIGHPLSHSLSPILHKTALQFAGLKGEYRLIDITPENLQSELAKALQIGLKGFNITIPYKEDIFRLVSNHSTEAKLTSAVNTVKVEKDGSLTGHNTDLMGFKQSFADSFATEMKDKTALVIGAGGAAKAVIVGLMQMKVAKIIIGIRNTEKVNSSIAKIKSNFLQGEENNYQLPQILAVNINDFDTIDTNKERVTAVINASPIGLHEGTAPIWLNELMDKLPANCVCFDLVYRKDRSEPTFTKIARAKNMPAVDGLSMLVHQARLSFKYWTDVDIPTSVLFASMDQNTKNTISSIEQI